jgi:hypothetical protein
MHKQRGKRVAGVQTKNHASEAVSELIKGAEVVDLIEQVPDGWYEITAVGGAVRMDVRRGHAFTLRISVNGHRLTSDSSEARQVFEQWPSQFTAVLLIAKQALDLAPGRYLVSHDGITAMPRTAFDTRTV